jgi:hypothetical protein
MPDAHPLLSAAKPQTTAIPNPFRAALLMFDMMTPSAMARPASQGAVDKW